MLKYKYKLALKYFNRYGMKFFIEKKRVYYKKDIDPNIIFDILNECKFEPKIQDQYIRSKYCPLCEKPHNEENTNLNTLIIYKISNVFHCYRCGHKGNFLRLFKILSKITDLSKFNEKVLGSKSGYGSGGNTTEYEDNQNEYRRSPSEIFEEKESIIQPNEIDTSDNFNSQTYNNSSNFFNSSQTNNTYSELTSGSSRESFNNSNYNNSQSDYKISINNSGLINELYRRNLLISNPKCSNIMDYLLNERKLKLETLIHYKVGVSYEKFKSNSYDYINLPCVTYPMFYPTDKNSFLAIDKGTIDDSIYQHYKCDKFYLARLKIRAIGKEFKHFQKMEPQGSLVWGLFGIDTVPADAEEIIITEGEYDAMAAYQELKIPAVSLPNGASSLPTQVLPYFQRFKRIYLWMDADQAGQIATENFSKKLGEKKTMIVNTRKTDPEGPKDANDALKEGKNLKDYIREAKPLSGDTIIKMSDIKSEIVQFLSQYDAYSGYKSTSFPFFNQKLKGLRMGEFSIFTGETGSGKTTFLSQLSLDFIEQRIPSLWGSFEIKNDKLASLFLMQHAKKNLRQCPIPEIEFHTENFEKLPLYMLKFHGSQSIDDVINSMTFAVYNYDIQNIVLDNLQFMIGSPGRLTNKFDYQDEIIHRLRKFATEKNVHVILVIHPRKDEVLKISSIFGTGKASQEADNIFILQSYKGLRIIEIAKNRFDGTTGKFALAFDQNSCRFFELEFEEFSQIVKSNVPIDEIIKERIKKNGSLFSDGSSDSLNKQLNQDHSEYKKQESIVEAFVSKKEKEIYQYNKDSRYFKESMIEEEFKIKISSSENGQNTTPSDLKFNKQHDILNTESCEVAEDIYLESAKHAEKSEVKKELHINDNQREKIQKEDQDISLIKDDQSLQNNIKMTNNIQNTNSFNKVDSRIDVNTNLNEPHVSLSKNVVNDFNNSNEFSVKENDLETLNQIKSFQNNIFPNIKEINSFHTSETQEKTQNNSQRQNTPMDKRDYKTQFKQNTYKKNTFDDIF